MAERVAPAPPRVEEQEKQLFERRDRFDVSEFNLPPGADVESDILLDATETYQEFQIPETGERYRLSYDPDQRPIGQRVREGAVAAGKAVVEYAKDPSLPSAEQVGDVAKSLEEQTREAMFGGQATLGEVAGFAAGSGIAGQFSQAPAGALRSFTGKTYLPEKNSDVSSGGAKSKREPKNVPTFKFKGQQADLPDPMVGTKALKDIFEEDRQDLLDVQEFDSQLLDEENWSINLGTEYDVERLGYARNIPLHELAQVKLGNKKVEDVINYYGDDPTSDIIDYVNSRLARLDNDPEFNDYVNSLRNNPDFDPNEALFEYSLPRGLAAEFRSPIAETVSELEYPSKGIEGYQLISALEKNPSIRKAELDTVLEDIDPKARYSKEEVENIVADNTWTTYAKVLSDNSPEFSNYGLYQRQNDLIDKEKDYFELPIISYRANSEKSDFVAKSQHFEKGTLAHSRASIRTDEMRGDDYLLVEELQSDLLQQGFEKPTKNLKRTLPEEAVQKTYAAREEWGLTDPADELLLQVMAEDKRYDLFYDSDTMERFIKEVGPENLTGKPGSTVSDVIINPAGEMIDTYELLSLYANYKAGTKADILPSNSDAWDIFDNFKDFYWGVLNKEINYADQPAVSAPPIKKIEESVKLTIKSLIAEADRRGIDRIVIPPFERIVEKRFNFGSDSYKKAIDKKSGFYKTYVKSVDKAIKELEDEFGKDKISKRLVDMNYKKTDIGSISDSLEKDLGFSPDNGWEDYFRNDFYDDYYASLNILSYDDLLPSGLTGRDLARIKVVIRSDLREYQFREYLDQSNPDFTKFLKGRVPELPVTGTEIDIKGLRQAGYDLSRPTFAEGGVVENQMDKLMQEGGMADDGMDRDPVTGNEIPPGSTAKEVRDDVDVKLSEGEYVVPADVVQYYGVKFFENLRDKAKDELEEMDKDGRIGGEPVPDNDDLTEEEMAMLTEALQSDPQGMAKGGMVSQQQVDPYVQQQMMYQQPMGMQQGGVVAPSVPGTVYGNPSLQQMFTPYGASQPAFVPGLPMGGATEFRQYINSETGEIRQFAFMNGQPVTPIPDGFEPYSKEALEKIQQGQQQVQTTGTREESGDGRAGIPDSEGAVSRRSFDPLKGVDFSDPESVKEWAEGKAEKSLLEIGAVGLGTTISPLLGGAAGAALETNDLAQVSAASQMASYLGQEDLATELDDVAENMQSGMGRLPGFLAKEQIAQGDNYFKSALEARLDPSVGGGLDRSQFGSDERFNEVMQEVAPSGMTYQPDRQVYTRDRDDDDDGRAGVSAPKTSPRPAPRPSPKPSPKPSPSRDRGDDDDNDDDTHLQPGASAPKTSIRPAPRPSPKPSPKPSPSQGGSGGGGGNNKIVCTAMNQSYGFGSFRNAIWLNYASKHLTPEHEKGYHKLFLPLVKLGYEKDFKFVRKVLEHIARHRTADIRAEMKNKKRNNLGRFYRAVLEPLCYFVGKFV